MCVIGLRVPADLILIEDALLAWSLGQLPGSEKAGDIIPAAA